MVVVGTGGDGTRFIKREYPNDEDSTATGDGTTKLEGRQINLVAEGLLDHRGNLMKTAVPSRETVGI